MEENEYEELFQMQKAADEKNKNEDREYYYAVDWSWTAEEEFFLSEDWY